jgi:hypothetical protein
MDRFANVLLCLAGLGFLGFGLWFVVDPVVPLASMGVAVSGAGATTEIRAFYGGLELGLGLFLLAAAFRRDWRRPALWLCLCANAGIGLVRGYGLLRGEPWIGFFGYALAWELGFAMLAALALAKRDAPAAQ